MDDVDCVGDELDLDQCRYTSVTSCKIPAVVNCYGKSIRVSSKCNYARFYQDDIIYYEVIKNNDCCHEIYSIRHKTHNN